MNCLAGFTEYLLPYNPIPSSRHIKIYTTLHMQTKGVPSANYQPIVPPFLLALEFPVGNLGRLGKHIRHVVRNDPADRRDRLHQTDKSDFCEKTLYSTVT